jgi:hypothetical protein
MDEVIRGIVRDGVVVPEKPLPEWARVEIRVVGVFMADLPDDLREELEAWQLAAAESLARFEQMLDAEEGGGGAAR